MTHSDTLASIWGKTNPFHPLLCHMIDTGSVAAAVLAQGPFSDVPSRLAPLVGRSATQIARWLPYLAALHDL
ncbi:MAG: HD domain-containing protein, partial [Clostridia bacterium]